jgi:hypothetical protein
MNAGSIQAVNRIIYCVPHSEEINFLSVFDEYAQKWNLSFVHTSILNFKSETDNHVSTLSLMRLSLLCHQRLGLLL